MVHLTYHDSLLLVTKPLVTNGCVSLCLVVLPFIHLHSLLVISLSTWLHFTNSISVAS